jgi:hypothetical protein
VEPVHVFQLEGTVLVVVAFALLAIKVFAFVSSLMFSSESYRAADKLTKPAWCAILGVGALAQIALLGSPLNLINLVLTIAALVYLADVRPALSGLYRR